MLSINKFLLTFFVFFSLNILGTVKPGTLYKSKLVEVRKSSRHIKIRTHLYGNAKIKKATREGRILSKIINHWAFKRLQFVNQYGPSQYLECARDLLYAEHPTQKYNRYEHSICVYMILRTYLKYEFLIQKYKQNTDLLYKILCEMVAGLIHDIAHPPFSHAGDLFIKYLTGKDHDERIEDFLGEVGLKKILEEEGFNLQAIIFNKEQINLIAVKCPKPFLSADRIEYTLTGAFLSGALYYWNEKKDTLDKKTIKYVLSKLKFNKQWYFETIKAAKLFGDASIYLTEQYTGIIWNTVLGQIILRILMEAYPKKGIRLISNKVINNILYKWGDKKLWKLIKQLAIKSPQIRKLVNTIKRMNHEENHPRIFGPAEKPRPHFVTNKRHAPAPSRICDPLVQTKAGPTLLSQISEEFEEYKIYLEGYLPRRHIQINDGHLALLLKVIPLNGY